MMAATTPRNAMDETETATAYQIVSTETGMEMAFPTALTGARTIPAVKGGDHAVANRLHFCPLPQERLLICMQKLMCLRFRRLPSYLPMLWTRPNM